MMVYARAGTDWHCTTSAGTSVAIALNVPSYDNETLADARDFVKAYEQSTDDPALLNNVRLMAPVFLH